MKRKILFVVIMVSIVLNLYAGEFITSAFEDDIEKFEKFIENGADLNETNLGGLNVQTALAYFSDENFERACEILYKKGFDFNKPQKSGLTLLYSLCYSLSYNKIETLLKYNIDVNKKVNGILPIQATQFAIYPFHTLQKRNALACYNEGKRIQKLLLKNGSEKFKYIEPTITDFGNFLRSNLFVIQQIRSDVTLDDVNHAADYYSRLEEGRWVVSMKYNSLKKLYAHFGIKIKISIAYGYNDIEAKIIDGINSNNQCLFIGQTGNNKIAPYQWVVLTKFPSIDKKYIDSNGYFAAYNPDPIFENVGFQFKDLTELIVIEICSYKKK